MNYRFREGLENITGSKLAFLDNCDTIKLVGDFETDEDGIKYSNHNYKNSYYDYYYDYSYYTSKDKIEKEYEYHDSYIYDMQLESEWYYSIKNGEMKKVGDRDLIYDYYDRILYQISESGQYIELGSEVEIYDEHGEEIIL